jgi:hypothetical protein
MCDLLSTKEFPSLEDTSTSRAYLAEIKAIQGNATNDARFVATLLAKEHHAKRYGLQDFDATDKPQGVPGIDIDVQLPDGKSLVAEIRTTTPYIPNDLGAQQKTTFEKDCIELTNATADVKLFLVTEVRTFQLMKKPKYRSQLRGVSIVLLTTDEEFAA